MGVFRLHTPKRSSITRTVSDYKDHKDDLKRDYKDRCGYCDSIDTWRFIWFEIDHFVPKKYLNAISDTDYKNLVYSCRSCNNAKRAKWPSKDENIPIVGDEGFIDPCDDKYNNQFERLSNGRILPKTNLGDWMYNALKLHKPQHEIIWNIHQIDLLIDKIEQLVDDNNDDELFKRLLNCYREFRKYVKALSDEGL